MCVLAKEVQPQEQRNTETISQIDFSSRAYESSRVHSAVGDAVAYAPYSILGIGFTAPQKHFSIFLLTVSNEIGIPHDEQ